MDILPVRARRLGFLFLVTAIYPLPIAKADVLILKDGGQLVCEVLGETKHAVRVRRKFRDTKISYVEYISKDVIERIEKGPVETMPAEEYVEPTPAKTATRPAQASDDPDATRMSIEQWSVGAPIVGPVEIGNKPRFLNNAIDKWKADDVFTAANDLTRLLTTVPRDELDALSPECEKNSGMSLADLAAQVHWQAARTRSRNGQVHLSGLTPYELEAVAALLAREYDSTVRAEILPESKGNAQSRPSDDAAAIQPADPAVELSNRLTILNWVDRPNQLNLSRAQAMVFVERLGYAIGLLNERIRLDPAVRRGQQLKTVLVGQRVQLLTLRSAASERAAGDSATSRPSAEHRRRRRPEPAMAEGTPIPPATQPVSGELLMQALQAMAGGGSPKAPATSQPAATTNNPKPAGMKQSGK